MILQREINKTQNSIFLLEFEIALPNLPPPLHHQHQRRRRAKSPSWNNQIRPTVYVSLMKGMALLSSYLHRGNRTPRYRTVHNTDHTTTTTTSFLLNNRRSHCNRHSPSHLRVK